MGFALVNPGCEIIDVQVLDYDTPARTRLLMSLKARQRSSLLIGSFHDITGSVSWSDELVLQENSITQPKNMHVAYAQLDAWCDIIKLIGTARNTVSNTDLLHFTATHTAKPLIALNMGEAGKLTRCLNSFLTPVTHPLLPMAAAPGQCSVREINTCRTLVGMQSPRKFYLFGTPISASKSPALHNAGFECLGLPFTYSLHETDNVDDISRVITANDFGGARYFCLNIVSLFRARNPCCICSLSLPTHKPSRL